MNEIDNIKSGMDIKHKIGQLLMLDFRYWGKDSKNEPIPFTEMNSKVAELIKKYSLGGIALFRENTETTEQSIKLTHEMQEAANIPLIIGIDQEGGVVTRLQQGTDMPGNMALGAIDDLKLTETVAEVIGNEIHALGINMNFAPDIDVNSNPANPIIGVRSFGSDPERVAEHGAAYLKGLTNVGIIPSVKHFPGHGDTATDTHHGLATVNYTVDELKKTDLVPFYTAIRKGTDTIMAAHVSVPSLDNTKYISKKDGKEIGVPTTLSRKILTDLLRSEMKYEGVVLTDAMDMKAISDNFGESKSVILSILAGADMQVMPVRVWDESDIYKLEDLINILENEYNTNLGFRDRVEESLNRLLNLKRKYNLLSKNNTLTLEDKLIEAEYIVECNDHKIIERTIAEKAVTLIKNQKNILPFEINENSNIMVVDSSEARLDVVKNELRRICGILNIKHNIKFEKISFTDELTDSLKNKIKSSEFIILQTYNLKEADKLPEAICRFANGCRIRNVVVSCRNPYDILEIPSCQSYLAVYGASGFDQTNYKQASLNINLETAVRTIFCSSMKPEIFNKPQGKLPVEISNEYPLGFNLKYC